MGRGVSFGGGQSSLGYLFGDGEAPKPTVNNAATNPNAGQAVKDSPSGKHAPDPQLADANKNIPAGVNRSNTNNYFRADGQNTGNFITERPSTKVQAVPGGGSSLDYLFGGGRN